MFRIGIVFFLTHPPIFPSLRASEDLSKRSFDTIIDPKALVLQTECEINFFLKGYLLYEMYVIIVNIAMQIYNYLQLLFYYYSRKS